MDDIQEHKLLVNAQADHSYILIGYLAVIFVTFVSTIVCGAIGYLCWKLLFD